MAKYRLPVGPDGKSRLPVGPRELRSYFASVTEKEPEDPHWRNGVEMCDWWLRLSVSSTVTQADIDTFIQRLKEEKEPGSGWADLSSQFKRWAESRGFNRGK